MGTDDGRRHPTCASCGLVVLSRDADDATPQQCERCGAWIDRDGEPRVVTAVRSLDSVPAG